MALQTGTNLRDEIYARSNLTRRQLLVWAAQKSRPDSTAYNVPFQFDISGTLDPGRFDAAFDLLIQKTDAPRTIFQESDGVPRQIPLDHVPRKNVFRNLTSERHPEAAALAIAHDLISRPFPLDQPLYRSILLQLAPEKFRWLVSQHHLITDGYSRMIWFERMSRLYLGEDSDDSPGYLLAAGDLSACKTLRRIHVGGEVVTPELVTRVFETLGAIELVNAYGPTEASVGVSFGICEPGTVYENVPIGRPIPNMQVYLLDQNMELVPQGVAGEMVIGGVGVAQGYLNCAQVTTDRFVPDPFSDGPGACLFRSGDVARFLPDGQLEFLGRVDNQVQVRGHRVEPGEIEALLHRHPAVAIAVVVQDSGTGQLQAHLALQSGSVPALGEIREFLSRFLPEYMVPADFRVHEKLPLLPSGKVDRRLLLQMMDGKRLANEYAAPRTDLEKKVAEVWQRVLNRERISRLDNLLELGGDSMTAIQIQVRLEQEFGIQVPVITLFDFPTVQAFAQELQTLLQDA